MMKRSLAAIAILVAVANGAVGREAPAALTAVKVTALGETGSTDLDATAGQIVLDTGNTKSYGFLGLNTRGDLPEFIQRYGHILGLQGRPGSREFDESWRSAAARSSELRDFQVEFHRRLIERGSSFLHQQGAPMLAGDPIVVAYVADIRIQYGWGLTEGHLREGLAASRTDPAVFMDTVDQSMRSNIGSNFRTYLAQYPDRLQALLNRIERRRRFAHQVAAEDHGRAGASAYAYRRTSATTQYVSDAQIYSELAQMFPQKASGNAPVRADELWPDAFGH